jgi:penicillin-binding protein 1C
MNQAARAKSARWTRRARRLRRLALGLLLAPLIAHLVFHAAVCVLPYPQHLEAMEPSGLWIEDRAGQPLAALVASDDQWRLPLSGDQFSAHLVNAIVAVEDARFYEHRGVDLKAAAAAAWQNVAAMKVKRGGSTLTMQLHRLRDPAPRSLWAKIEQAVRAAQIEERLGKRQIVEEYLNRAPFGGNLVGAGAASWRYFGKPCSGLSLAQAALLAGLPQNPNYLRPDRHPERARARRAHVLDRMLACGFIDAGAHAEAMREPLDAAWRPLPQMPAGSAHARAGAALAQGAMPFISGLAAQYRGAAVRTTLDLNVQRQAAAQAGEHLARLESSGVRAIAVVVLDTPSAQCLASVSLCRDNANLDLTRCARSTGSALKPFIYAASFDAGICSPATILRDSPAAWPGYAPDNYDRQFRGSIPAADALAESRNIPALSLLAQVGVERAAGVMSAVGLRTVGRTPYLYGLSLAIGGAEATPIELAEAYATLARGGTYRPTQFVLSVGTSTVHPASRSSAGCLPDWACWQTLRAISDPDRTGAMCAEARHLGVAWKTGTSSGHRDAWCAAVTPSRTVVVWVGNPTGRGASPLVGAEAAAPLALRLIGALDRQGGTWPQPTGAPAITHPVARAARRQLTLLSPIDGMEIVYDPDAPARAQQVLLRAMVTTGPDATGEQAGPLWWFIDGRPVGVTRDRPELWWPPATGSHEVRVVDEQGHAARARFRVR